MKVLNVPNKLASNYTQMYALVLASICTIKDVRNTVSVDGFDKREDLVPTLRLSELPLLLN